MSEESKPVDRSAVALVPQPATWKRSPWLPVIVVFVVFLLGFVPMWVKSSRLARNLHTAQVELRLKAIQIALANASLDARRGDYEPARQGMTSFFNLVTAELDRGSGSALPAGALGQLQPLLAQRDDLITLLARGDPAAGERLATAYVSFQKAIGK
jgi:hypothetical protein